MKLSSIINQGYMDDLRTVYKNCKEVKKVADEQPYAIIHLYSASGLSYGTPQKVKFKNTLKITSSVKRTGVKYTTTKPHTSTATTSGKHPSTLRSTTMRKESSKKKSHKSNKNSTRSTINSKTLNTTQTSNQKQKHYTLSS